MPENTNQTEVFHCPCCGQVAPTIRLTELGPFTFDMTTYRWGGSRPLTEAELEKRFTYGRGSAPGIIKYDEPWQEPSLKMIEALRDRLNEILEIIR